MLTRIVILYIVYALEMPEWCAWIMWTGIVLNGIKLLHGLWENGKEYGECKGNE